MTQQELGSGR